ncbi:histidinol-phosphatase [Capsaspora owczarzaki ATCC 30864]|uniref:histidinol-phosphatase n=1 Tax=Capsaspora owczarzaki (strain ATCC 30864) TaxID=595528 RepID=A0A0D2VQP5_CAPO3|nr:histidinol-phosphatase [Capsaspora owczarzaki ATCC 30864]KJE93022.1 histidinol-phosphatase [Capsaspora owczarzaki ATCC 30864]|eukprot:XP_004363612.1 histidinol-phosphatase [Capsaspora owczarzaki ATCC 30864]
MPFTYHSHSGQFCLHAAGTLEAVVLRAIDAGFTHIGLSEHMPRTRESQLYNEEKHLAPAALDDMFTAYIAEARRLRDKYGSRIHIVIGMETEYFGSETIAEIRALVARHEIEYLVGSVHHVHGIPTDYSSALCNDAETAAGGSSDQLFQAYFEHQYALINALQPQVVGHFDVIRLYRRDAPLSAATWELIDRNIRCAVSYGALFEINSRALKKMFAHPYPQLDIAQRILSLGGKFTICDDSHGENDVAMHYDQLPSYLELLNIDTVYLLERVKDAATGAVTTVTRPVDWRTHPYWSAKAKAPSAS